MMKLECETVRDLLPLYQEGLLSEKTNTALREHIESCEECCAINDRMGIEIDLNVKVKKPPKNILLYLNAIRLWYVICPSLALLFQSFGLSTVYWLYIGVLALFSAICLLSQFASGLTQYGWDSRQYKMQVEAEEKEKSVFGGFYASPFAWCLPCLVVIAVYAVSNIFF